ncbi:MAG: hypothetical protein KGI94_05710 [Paracoccaceae bacterium]|nr:hypothetical protein [Paracoccaceae bacterium]MDE3120741.1 hypothetical protein [Paracoccaceae bacterium]MDE3239379.1 hypothetical protein [Paracoccaceae bacterium]
MTTDRMTRRGFAKGAAQLLGLPAMAGLIPAQALAANRPQNLQEHSAQMTAKIVPFATSPFPYHGTVPDTGAPFLDYTGPDGRLGHRSPRGGVYYLDQTYSDQSVLLAIPGSFDLNRKAAIVVFFHGNQATLERDVIGKQRVLQQFQAARINAAFVAPQLAVDALDSSAGKFWEPGAFARFMAEAATRLAELWGDPAAWVHFAGLPIIMVAFSGGYDPMIFAATEGRVGNRVAGMVLLDALFGEEELFAFWISQNRNRAFFLSAYTEAAQGPNETVMSSLKEDDVRFTTHAPRWLGPGTISFFETPNVDHVDYITQAWVKDPVTWTLDRVAAFAR